MLVRFNEVKCDSCDTWADGDPGEYLLANIDEAALILDPEHRKMIQHFYLCPECREHYPKGARDFFLAEVFENIPRCSEGCGDEVEKHGHVCEGCEDYGYNE